MSVSPLAPAAFPDLPPIAGVALHAYAAGLRYDGRPDLMLAVMPEGTTVGGVFTQSACASAPVDWCRAILPGGAARFEFRSRTSLAQPCATMLPRPERMATVHRSKPRTCSSSIPRAG